MQRIVYSRLQNSRWTFLKDVCKRRVNVTFIHIMSRAGIVRRCSWNAHLWNLKKTKSLWLWKVATCRPTNWGSCGKRAASRRPTLWPRRVLKLFRITSGECSVGSLPRLYGDRTRKWCWETQQLWGMQIVAWLIKTMMLGLFVRTKLCSRARQLEKYWQECA